MPSRTAALLLIAPAPAAAGAQLVSKDGPVADSAERLIDGAGYGNRVRAAYLARGYHEPGDEVDPDWDVTGIVSRRASGGRE